MQTVVIEGFSVDEVIAKHDILSHSVLQRWIHRERMEENFNLLDFNLGGDSEE